MVELVCTVSLDLKSTTSTQHIIDSVVNVTTEAPPGPAKKRIRKAHGAQLVGSPVEEGQAPAAVPVAERPTRLRQSTRLRKS